MYFVMTTDDECTLFHCNFILNYLYNQLDFITFHYYIYYIDYILFFVLTTLS